MFQYTLNNRMDYVGKERIEKHTWRLSKLIRYMLHEQLIKDCIADLPYWTDAVFVYKRNGSRYIEFYYVGKAGDTEDYLVDTWDLSDNDDLLKMIFNDDSYELCMQKYNNEALLKMEEQRTKEFKELNLI